MKSPPKVTDTGDEMVIVHDVPVLVEKAGRLRAAAPCPAWPPERHAARRDLGAALGTRRSRRQGDSVPRGAGADKAHAIRFKAAKTRARRRDITVRDRVLDALRVYRRDQLELRIQLGMGRLPDDALLFTDLDGKPRSLYAVSSASGLLRGEDRDAGRDVPRPEAHPRLPN